MRIAARLGRKHPEAALPGRAVVGAAGLRSMRRITREEITAQFCAELEAQGGVSIRCASTGILQDELSHIVLSLSPRRIAWWEDGLAESLQLDRRIYDHLYDHPQEREAVGDTARGDWLERTARADIGITGCDYAIAETGTVVLLAGRNQGRSVSLLPGAHIVLVRGSCIRMHMGDVLHELSLLPDRTGTSLPAVNFISGPSRSSDIENDLSIGVHGPAALFALILED